MADSDTQGIKEYGSRYANGVLDSFLKGKQDNITKLIGEIRYATVGHGLSRQELENIFAMHKDHSNPERWQKVYTECQNQGLL